MDTLQESKKRLQDVSLKSKHYRSKPILLAGIMVSLFVVCWYFYGRCCDIGFTLDEFTHIPCIADAFNGHPHDLIGRLFGPYTGNAVDGMRAYRPVTVLCFTLIYFFCKIRAFGWHVCTIVAFFSTCFAAGMVTFELLRHSWNIRSRAFAGIFTSLLMITYPGHPDCAVTIVGLCDSLAATFWLSSFYLYSLSRHGQERRFLYLSIGCFLLALGAKETAVTLPLVICVGEVLGIFQANSKQKNLWTSLRSILSKTSLFWLTLAGFACVRTLFLHSVVGGYGKIKLVTLVEKFGIFGNVDSLCRTVLPINVHFSPPDLLVLTLNCLYGYAVSRLLFRLIKDKPLRELTVFFLLFAVINVLPAFQIWYIWPNLVGMRLFFISSVALMFLLAIALTPNSKKLMTNILDGTCGLSILIIWGVILNYNLLPFQISGLLMQSFRSQITTMIGTLPKDEFLIVTNLPKDYCGAPMLGPAPFLGTTLRPPFSASDLSARVIVIEDGKFKNLTGNPVNADRFRELPVYAWSNKLSAFVERPAVQEPEKTPAL